MICRGSDGSGYPVDGARCCSVCGVAFEGSRIPQHVTEEAEGIDWDEILREWAR
jgi:hypothetical protein